MLYRSFNVYAKTVTSFDDVTDDVIIHILTAKCYTWTLRKPTHTGLLLNFNALCPIKWKSGLILCLLHPAKTICSILRSHVVYKFTFWCDANLTYFGKCARHLNTWINEHLNLADLKKIAVKDHLSCAFCLKNCNSSSFSILKKCRTDFQTKIDKALLIKKHRPGLNRQLYGQGSISRSVNCSTSGLCFLNCVYASHPTAFSE